MFNLDSLALKTDTTFVQLRHPVSDEPLTDGNGKPVGVHVFGTASKEYRTAIKDMQNRALKRGKKPLTAEAANEEAVNLLVAVSDRAENLEYDGKALTSDADFRKLYADPKFSWLRDQIDTAVGDTASFLDQ